jgi:hypothetical protein
MTRRWAGVLVVVAVIAVAAVVAYAALPQAGSPTPSPSSAAASASAPGTTSADTLTSPVTGIVLHVDSPSLGKVTGFRLVLQDGRQVDFVMGVQENAADFPAAHLNEHVASSEPVAVYFRVEGSRLVVYRLEDATLASPAASPSADRSGLPL